MSTEGSDASFITAPSSSNLSLPLPGEDSHHHQVPEGLGLTGTDPTPSHLVSTLPSTFALRESNPDSRAGQGPLALLSVGTTHVMKGLHPPGQQDANHSGAGVVSGSGHHPSPATSLRARIQTSITRHPNPSGSHKASSIISRLLTPERPVGPAPTVAASLRAVLLYSYFNILLLFLPIAWTLHFLGSSAATVFTLSFLSVISLGKIICFLTDELTLHLHSSVGGLLGVTMGNSVEFISAIIALKSCQLRVVQSALLGAMLTNLSMGVGLCFFWGGTRFSEQGFSVGKSIRIANVNSSLLTVAVIAVLLPAAYHFSVNQNIDGNGQSLSASRQSVDILKMSRGAAVVLMSRASIRIVGIMDPADQPSHSLRPVYCFFVLFQIFSHRDLYDDQDESNIVQSTRYSSSSKLYKLNGGVFPIKLKDVEVASLASSVRSNEVRGAEMDEDEMETPMVNVKVALVILLVAIGLVVVTLEWLVSAMTTLTSSGTLSKEWVGLILIPLLSGNTSERLVGISVSVKDKLTLVMRQAVGSSIQIALFVIPLVICVAWVMDKPLTLLFDPFECVALFMLVLTLNYIVADGKTNWFEGMILLHLYVLVAVTFWFYPGYDPTNGLLTCS
ncbi:hypothetical protein JAAARDRAFT_209543 [Jaapia argillacea MUCL 33604]|uniref:Sodium/calcium exchanger membrane region domain-containing protein n=1 Tax=Jaapia argillacea MUCL 33604 TaxID=933084 RepID=A0A067PJP9_9AGAM|nr:hypothetical protein JAAARDRAFT_209543 [Jaapia argillacea MUCL 33604]